MINKNGRNRPVAQIDHRKLRWIGMEREAERVQMARCGHTPANGMLAAPPETD
jgi:hypothetical protein